MFKYRVSKYNPKHRDIHGRYLLDDWTAISDIGREFGGQILTTETYQKVENSYLDAAMAFVNECGVAAMYITYSPDQVCAPSQFKSGDAVQPEAVREIVRALLREEYWCKLEAGNGTYISIGYDFLMGLGSPHDCKEWQSAAMRSGLFIETSP